MKQNKTHRNSDAALLQGLGVSKSKLIIAVVLVTVMAFMWLRLLIFNKSPGAAAGGALSGSVGAQAGNNTTKSAPELTYIELPFVPGRHDVLANDIFRSGTWRVVGGAQNTAGESDGLALTAADIRKITASITLDGVIAEQGTRAPEAFINGKLVSVGSKVAVEYNKRSVELTVTEIHRNKVVLRVGEQEINVKMLQSDPSG
ncbi:MAG: hypothetical protein DRP66_11360 [Planctomycetota bacterium]|nr:MAG: hypothetical protein DRP66_11360 [Planctomycetota bacterium]